MYGYDNSKQVAYGMVSFKLMVGSGSSTMTCQIIEVESPHSMILGRPWLDSVGAISSTRHQCV
ncbi:hypothetical protein QJS04_geneDACA022591 [Acorus gramineus]|uniref:Uncharacterized protein n=1 Tax=Acorus gramineus TaxID=55184 RepID=A0AAV8ZY43_ACOGR|nr:hypothetical protein QJS04_geneDACA022591 [Acorus gramineus]